MMVTTLVLHLLGEESLSDVVQSENHSNSEEYSLEEDIKGHSPPTELQSSALVC